MRRFILLLTTLTLAACATNGTTDVGNNSQLTSRLTIRLEKTVTEDAQAIPHTKATLHVSGTADATIDLGDIQGELMHVNPESYPAYAEDENKPETIAIFTAWFGGQGEDITVQLHNRRLIVTKRYGGEEDVCTKPEELANVPLPQDVVVEWENVDLPKTDKSSIAFCDQQ